MEAADWISVTATSAAERMGASFGPKIREKIRVIPPVLYPAPSFERGTTTQEKPLKMGYFGAFYAPVRTPYAFFDLLHQLEKRDILFWEKTEIHFYGEVFPEFLSDFRQFPGIKLHGLKSREAVREAMAAMDILLNIGNTTAYQLPSKAIEYLAVGKPVMHLSYVEKDPFAEVFDGWAGLLRVQVAEGKVPESAVQSVLNFMQKHPESSDIAWRQAKIKPFLVENVAAEYLRQ